MFVCLFVLLLLFSSSLGSIPDESCSLERVCCDFRHTFGVEAGAGGRAERHGARAQSNYGAVSAAGGVGWDGRGVFFAVWISRLALTGAGSRPDVRAGVVLSDAKSILVCSLKSGVRCRVPFIPPML